MGIDVGELAKWGVKAVFLGVGGRLNLAPATRAQGERSAFAPDLEGQLGSRTKFDRKSKQAHDLWCVALALSLSCTFAEGVYRLYVRCLSTSYALSVHVTGLFIYLLGRGSDSLP